MVVPNTLGLCQTNIFATLVTKYGLNLELWAVQSKRIFSISACFLGPWRGKVSSQKEKTSAGFQLDRPWRVTGSVCLTYPILCRSNYMHVAPHGDSHLAHSSTDSILKRVTSMEVLQSEYDPKLALCDICNAKIISVCHTDFTCVRSLGILRAIKVGYIWWPILALCGETHRERDVIWY